MSDQRSSPTPDYEGLVVGVRTWRVANTVWAEMGGWLWSMSMLDCWRKGREWKVAECTKEHRIPHRIPGDKCGCGIWAFHNPAIMESEFGPISAVPDSAPAAPVTGIIGGGGDILDHELGFRAEYAKVLGIFSDEWDTPKDKIAAQHNCPIIAPGDYDAFCADHPHYRLIRLDKE